MSSIKLLDAMAAARLQLTRLAEADGAPRVLSAPEARTVITAQEMLEAAQRVLDEAHVEAATLRDEARREGEREGFEQVHDALSKARAEYDALMARAEDDLVEMALALAERIVGHSLVTAPAETLEAMMTEALEAVAHHRRVEVRVHPSVFPALQARLPLPGRAVRLVEAPEVPPTGCHIYTEAGIIEADLQTQLAVLGGVLRDRHGDADE